MMLKEKVVFRLSPEIIGEATAAKLLGDFNNWNPEEAISLHKQYDGSFSAEVELETGEYQYRYCLNDGRWVNDYNEAVPSPAYGHHYMNCVVRVHAPQVQEMPVIAEEAIVVSDDANGNESVKAETIKGTIKKATTSSGKVARSTRKDEKVANAGQFAKQFHDLTKINGITKDVEKVLNNADIRTYGLLAKTSVKRLKAALEVAGEKFTKVDPASWPKQARLASSGNWDDLESLKAELKKKK